MFRYLQTKIGRGRSLDMTDDATILMGDTHFIAVDRDNILDTTFDELKTVQDPRVTFQVDFMVKWLRTVEGQERNGLDSVANTSRQNTLTMDLRNT